MSLKHLLSRATLVATAVCAQDARQIVSEVQNRSQVNSQHCEGVLRDDRCGRENVREAVDLQPHRIAWQEQGRDSLHRAGGCERCRAADRQPPRTIDGPMDVDFEDPYVI